MTTLVIMVLSQFIVWELLMTKTTSVIPSEGEAEAEGSRKSAELDPSAPSLHSVGRDDDGVGRILVLCQFIGGSKGTGG